ncbi:MAG: hypothetical protein QE570_22305 [Verrucomicrobiota bacterium]|nr:hypothetical protein [Verrucomicrobiaceae bacterium]MDH4455913.1 hypothetical protein [Verrucomicrobiota bacterium]
MIRLLRAFQMLVLIGSLGVLILIVIYCTLFSSGHTGIEPRFIGLPFLGVLAVGIMSIAFRVIRGFASGALIVVGISGVAIGPFIHAMTILMQYDLWIEAGMPEQNRFTAIWMLAYVGATTLLMIFVGRSLSTQPHRPSHPDSLTA